ncbi:MAG TPA: deoxyribonuclease IV [Candidatus Acidoferrales bacterium]|nr:deoxyribonuclease IV [Candidatus Acidoferrales bacterium]
MRALVGMAVSASGGIDMSIDRAEQYGCTTMQTFVSSPMIWKVKGLGKEEAAAFKEKANEKGISPTVIHMPYLPNFASPDKTIYEKSKEALRLNIERCNEIGIDYLVLHLGSDMGKGKEYGISRVIDAVSEYVDGMEGKLLLENQSGSANSVGSDLNDLRSIYEGIGSKKAGYCIDTCHAFAAGYDIRKKEVVQDMMKAIDFDQVHVIHVNDSKFDLGMKRDRHEKLGVGYIGIVGFKTFLGFREIKSKALILETPTDRAGDESVEEVSKLRGLVTER